MVMMIGLHGTIRGITLALVRVCLSEFGGGGCGDIEDERTRISPLPLGWRQRKAQARARYPHRSSRGGGGGGELGAIAALGQTHSQA